MNVKSSQVQSGRQRPKRVSSLVHSAAASGKAPGKGKARTTIDVYWSKRPVELFSFDEDYLRRLGAQDPATEAHFVSYFSERLKMVLRARGVDTHTIDEVRQETFCRVWGAVRSGEVRNPSGFGSYVHSVCKNVLSETRRDIVRNQHDPLDTTDVADQQLDLEKLMQQKQNGKLVREILAMLPERDRHILRARFFEERENEDVCLQFGIDRDYLRVLLHRAINRFGEIYRKKSN
jgi:RNA polymerase sigma-70 factor, ECF subfamily